MSVEFVDTNVLIYAFDPSARVKRDSGMDLLARLSESSTGALSTQVLAEFYSVSTRKLGVRSEDAEAVVSDFGEWKVHRPSHADLLRAVGLERRYKIPWWDAMVLNSALALEASILWTEDFAHGQKFGSLTVKNPFRK
jgi:predicted nucleic acid-binding protein